MVIEIVSLRLLFCRTIDVACKVYKLASDAFAEVGVVGLYHASITQATKLDTQKRFSDSRIRVLAATVAFGMVCLFPKMYS